MNSDPTVHTAATSAGIRSVSDFGAQMEVAQIKIKIRLHMICAAHTVMKTKQMCVTYEYVRPPQ